MIKKEKYYIELNKQKIPVIINRKKIKNTYIRISDNNEIEVNTNYLVPYSDIEKLIIAHQTRILTTLEKKKAVVKANEIVYLGKIYELKINFSNKIDYKIENYKIIIDVYNESINVTDFLYKMEANRILPQRFFSCFVNFNKIYQLQTPKMSIRKMLKRYGTCYFKKNHIILNQNLVKMDLEFIDYVIYHELSHLVVANHSKEFYSVLKTFVPNHKSLRKK